MHLSPYGLLQGKLYWYTRQLYIMLENRLYYEVDYSRYRTSLLYIMLENRVYYEVAIVPFLSRSNPKPARYALTDLAIAL